MNVTILRCFLCITISLLIPAIGYSESEPLGTLEKVSSEWVKTRVETVRAETEWASQRELLGSMVKALEERARSLEEKRDLVKAKTAKDRSEVESMEATNSASAESLKTVEAGLKVMAEKLVQLRPQLPPRLSAALELPFRSIAESTLPPSERMQLTMTILNRCAQFNRTISSGDDVVAIDGEAKPKLLQTIYWGLSHGYAWDRTTGKTWIGSPKPNGWQWELCPQATKAVSALIATNSEKAEPEFVAVPARAGHSLTPVSSK